MSESPARRVCRFVPAWAVIVLVATLASLAVNIGPGVSALVDYATHGHTATVAGPSAPLVSPVAASENDPGWDCRTQGNRWCGPGVDGGPLVDAASGWVTCPRGGDLFEPATGAVCRYDTTEKIFTGGDFR